MAESNKNIYSLLRGSFLTDDDAYKNWRVILFVVSLLLIMIWSSHSIDEKVVRISELNKKKRELREIHIDAKRSMALMKLESSVRKKLKNKGLAPAKTPPQKIKLTIKE